MSSDKFYETIRGYVKDESHDDNKYEILAKSAPTEKARKILLDIAAEEKIHKKFLEEILKDGGYSLSSESPEKNNIRKPNVYGAKSNADDKIDYPDYIENVGLDEDEVIAEDDE